MNKKVPVDEVKVGDRIKSRHDGIFDVLRIEEFSKSRRFHGRDLWQRMAEMRRSSMATVLMAEDATAERALGADS